MMRKHMPNQNITTNIHVTNSQIGVLNTGSIQDVHAIDASITALNSKGDIDVGDAFKTITELDFGRFRRREREHFPCAARYGTEFLYCLGLAGT